MQTTGCLKSSFVVYAVMHQICKFSMSCLCACKEVAK